MNVNFNPNIGSVSGNPAQENLTGASAPNKVDFGKAIGKYVSNVNEQQADANASIVDLLSGKQQDINTVVASVAKADMSFKLLVGVRNKLVEAYKETMKMQI